MDRKEAIDIIRKNIPHLGIGSTEMTEALNELIPELRESQDEKTRKALVKIVKSIGLKVFETEGVGKNDILLYLERQQEQKPVEWSDEDISERVTDWFYEQKATFDKYGYTNIYVSSKDMMDFAKGFCRPHWKPTQEQMEALHKAIKKAYHDYDARPLESLYTDLLKLKSL